MATPKPNTLRLTLARNIRQARKHRGWSQEQLAERASLSSVYISQIESSRKAASVDVIELLALGFETPAEQLLRS